MGVCFFCWKIANQKRAALMSLAVLFFIFDTKRQWIKNIVFLTIELKLGLRITIFIINFLLELF